MSVCVLTLDSASVCVLTLVFMGLFAVSHRCLLCSVLGNSSKNICSNLTSNHLRFSQLQNILSRTRFPVGGKTYPESHVVLELFTFGPDSVKILVVSLQQIDFSYFLLSDIIVRKKTVYTLPLDVLATNYI